MQGLRRRQQTERVDGELAMCESHPPRAAAEQRGQLFVTPAEIEDHGDGVVLLRMRDDEVEQERLPRAGRALDEGVTDVVMVEVPEIWRLVLGLEDREALAASELGARARSGVERKEKAQVRDIGVEDSQTPEVVGRIAGHDGEPGVQEVVRLLIQGALVPGKGLRAFRDALVQASRIAIEGDDG